MQKTELLEHGKYYHIYNCGINGVDLFRIKEDYERFLRLYEKYILPVCETYAWVLMKNHFHFMVKIKDNIVYKYSNDDESFDKERFNDIKWETVDILSTNITRSSTSIGLKDASSRHHPKDLAKGGSKLIPEAHLHFSHLFNAYAKYFNTKYDRHGSLFERQFKRKKIDNIRYFQTVVIYIHQNPVHHGFCEHPLEYGWSSYHTCISINPTKLKREETNGWFGNMRNFKNLHDKKVEIDNIEYYLEL